MSFVPHAPQPDTTPQAEASQPFTPTDYDQWLARQMQQGEEFTIDTYLPPGPVAKRFLHCDKPITAIMGPIGSGKTSAAIYKCLIEATKQPACLDGVRRVRGYVLRPTYRVLYNTTIASWLEWFPLKKYPNFSGGSDRPAVHHLKFDVLIGGKLCPLDFEMHFQAVGDNNVEHFLRGLNGSLAFFDELDLTPQELYSLSQSRLGRYPQKKLLPEGAEPMAKIICCFNAPPDDNWTIPAIVESDNPDLGFYRQPSGTSPDAENLKNLPKGYYERAQNLMDKWQYRRMVLNMPAPARGGEVIYPEWDDDLHLSKNPLTPLENYPIKIGLDQGIANPAAIISQHMPNGQWRILEEYTPERITQEDFSSGLVQILQDRYRDNPISLVAVDPAGFMGSGVENYICWAEVVQRSLGFRLTPAPTQNIGMRLSAVRMQLKQLVSAGIPMFLVDKNRCPNLVKGFRSGYCWHKNKATDQVDVPHKNKYSNPHDALQYLIYTALGHAGVVDAAALGNRAGALKRTQTTGVIPSNFKLFG